MTLYDQMRFQGFKIKITPIPKDTTLSSMFYYRWYRDNVPLADNMLLAYDNRDYRFPTGYF